MSYPHSAGLAQIVRYNSDIMKRRKGTLRIPRNPKFRCSKIKFEGRVLIRGPVRMMRINLSLDIVRQLTFDVPEELRNIFQTSVKYSRLPARGKRQIQLGILPDEVQ